MNQVKFLGKLDNLSYFDKNTLSQYVNSSDNALYTNVKRWLKEGILLQLKRGLYVTRRHYERLQDKDVYQAFIGNKLREPSYLSLEYILQRYSMLTEAVYGITSVTLKKKWVYTNQLGLFMYHNITESLFTGYEINSYGIFQIKEATKAKALFDYLYFKLLRIKTIDQDLLLSFRLNLDEMNPKDKKEFSEYCYLTKIKKMLALPKQLWKAYD